MSYRSSIQLVVRWDASPEDLSEDNVITSQFSERTKIRVPETIPHIRPPAMPRIPTASTPNRVLVPSVLSPNKPPVAKPKARSSVRRQRASRVASHRCWANRVLFDLPPELV